jgi:large subunit ribosomal protein L10
METKREPAEYKKKVVNDLVNLMKQYPIIGTINMENLPAAQLQVMRRQLKDVVILMTKRRLIKLAIDQIKDKKDFAKIKEHLKGMPALLFTKENPFKIYKILQKSKSNAPAKPGQTAPSNISIPKGPTQFAPGPIIGELGMMGIKTTVEGGKVAVAADTVVVKEGQIITDKVASLLLRFGIEPMEIGLNVVAIYEDGTIYTRDILSIDEEAFLKSLADAHRWAMNLAVEAGYFTKETVEVMISKAFNEAKAVVKEGNIMSSLLAEELVEQAQREAVSVKDEGKIEANTEMPESKKEHKHEEHHKTEEAHHEKHEEKKKEIEEDEEEIKEPTPAELLKQAQKKAAQMKIDEEKKKEADETSRLYEELKKKGTLKDIGKKETKPVPQKPTPQDIINRALNKE